MKRQPAIRTLSPGYSLLELMLVLSLLGACLTAGALGVSAALERHRARGGAQSLQAALAWAQVGVLWQGGASGASVGPAGVTVSHADEKGGGVLGALVPVPSAVDTNIPRWRSSSGVVVTVGGCLASPDSGGSVYFGASGGAYRVVIRPETGLTSRGWVDR